MNTLDQIVTNNINMSETRLQICYRCPIYSTKYGGLCNNKLWLNQETGDISTIPKPGYERGCGCLLDSKVKNPASSCPLDKW